MLFYCRLPFRRGQFLLLFVCVNASAYKTVNMTNLGCYLHATFTTMVPTPCCEHGQFLQSQCWKRSNIDYPMTPGDQMVAVAICYMLRTVYHFFKIVNANHRITPDLSGPILSRSGTRKRSVRGHSIEFRIIGESSKQDSGAVVNE